jgi:exodeoxyribonuclease VII small subunit
MRIKNVPKKKKTEENFHFETSLEELENLVESLEQGDLSLEESLQHFERGIALTRACQKALGEAEQKVKILLEKNGESSLEELDNED